MDDGFMPVEEVIKAVPASTPDPMAPLSISISIPSPPIPARSRWKNTMFPAAAVPRKAFWYSSPVTPSSG
jgi:hypothetical protein